MHQTYTEFIETDHNMGIQRLMHLTLYNITAAGIKTGIFKHSSHDITMKSLYKKIFASSHNTSSLVAAHRLHLYLLDGMEKEAIEQLSLISSTQNTSIFSILNHSFLLAMLNKMPSVVSAFFAKGFPININRRVLGSKHTIAFPTYFLMALAGHHLATIMVFFERTIDFQETWHGLGPVHLAAVNPDIRVLDMVLTEGGDPMEYITTEQYSLLSGLAAREEKKKPTLDPRPIYPIDLAAASSNWGALLLLFRKAPKSVINSQHILHILNSLEMAIKAINIGARVETSLADGSSLLHTKASGNKAEMISFYLGLGLPIEAANAAGSTPLAVALDSGHTESVWVLLSHHARIPAEYADHPVLVDISSGRYAPDPVFLEKLSHYHGAALQAVIVKHKPKSRFSIASMFQPGQKTIESVVQTLNAKIAKAGAVARASPPSLQEEDLYEQFLKLLTGPPEKRDLHRTHSH
ncbi:hypothetical protein NEDG_00120 [Nematocida displodere]|uniref:Uncharacterized protein n=1 Tax=Nematocida displodere TaxID=1805483 RepID=A0A177EI44_9MICR|nr:hypothetical protein NEDG_00120 [Nematocida displodere]